MDYLLYGDKGSGAFCIEACLAEAGARYDYCPVRLDNDKQRTPEFRAINPSGKVPALKLSSGEIMTESSALLVLLAERHPEAKLLPLPGTPERGRALRWIAFMASEIYPIVEISDYPERFVTDHKAVAELKRSARDRVRARMAMVEAAVTGPWFLGEAFSALDIYAVMFSRWRECRSEDWRDENLPKICAIAAALSGRPALAPVWSKYFPEG